VYTLTKDRPGSDVVGAMAAALASASVIFKDVNPAYSAQLLSSALKAYDFASKYIGSYNNAIWDAANFYRSSNMYDDLAWAAVWLAVRTGEQKFKDQAKMWYDKHWKEENGAGVWNNFDWDSNSWGVVVFLSRWFPNDAFFKTRMEGFINDWLKGGSWVRKTPRGLSFSGDWGSLRHVGNALFLMKAYAAKTGNADLIRKIDCFAHDQMDYIFGGKTGRSYVVGYGPNPPQQPHHRAASCPALGTPCGWDYFNSRAPNPHTLYGALVGGPNANDQYDDSRNNFVQNEVATDYNGGFTGALAGLVNPSITARQCKGGKKEGRPDRKAGAKA
jgi:endoglucanase